jgi:hypothetical protein
MVTSLSLDRIVSINITERTHICDRHDGGKSYCQFIKLTQKDGSTMLISFVSHDDELTITVPQPKQEADIIGTLDEIVVC